MVFHWLVTALAEVIYLPKIQANCRYYKCGFQRPEDVLVETDQKPIEDD